MLIALGAVVMWRQLACTSAVGFGVTICVFGRATTSGTRYLGALCTILHAQRKASSRGGRFAMVALFLHTLPCFYTVSMAPDYVMEAV